MRQYRQRRYVNEREKKYKRKYYYSSQGQQVIKAYSSQPHIKSKINIWRRRWRKERIKHRICIRCGRDLVPSNKNICNICTETRLAYNKRPIVKKKKAAGMRRLRAKRKHEIYTHYKPICACCGETERTFLTIDHINGNPLKLRTDQSYEWIIKNNFPKDIRILCANCNYGRNRNNNICPHIKVLSKKNTKLITQRETIYKHYGNRCVCCGETQKLFFELDHKKNNGRKHRKSVGNGSSMYAWICRNNFPSTFQILCSNCNVGRAKLKICPHKRTTRPKSSV